MRWIYWATLSILWAILIWYLTSTPQLVVVDQPWFQTILMAGAHFFFFGVQAVFLRLTFSSIFLSLITTSLYGALIEYLQLSIPGRSADPVDWALDTLGALVFLAIIKKLNIKSEF